MGAKPTWHSVLYPEQRRDWHRPPDPQPSPSARSVFGGCVRSSRLPPLSTLACLTNGVGLLRFAHSVGPARLADGVGLPRLAGGVGQLLLTDPSCAPCPTNGACAPQVADRRPCAG